MWLLETNHLLPSPCIYIRSHSYKVYIHSTLDTSPRIDDYLSLFEIS